MQCVAHEHAMMIATRYMSKYDSGTCKNIQSTCPLSTSTACNAIIGGWYYLLMNTFYEKVLIHTSVEYGFHSNQRTQYSLLAFVE